MIYEFQLQTAAESWRDLGIARTPDLKIDAAPAFEALRNARHGDLPAGIYRLRAIPAQTQWRRFEVDAAGVPMPLDVTGEARPDA